MPYSSLSLAALSLIVLATPVAADTPMPANMAVLHSPLAASVPAVVVPVAWAV